MSFFCFLGLQYSTVFVCTHVLRVLTHVFCLFICADFNVPMTHNILIGTWEDFFYSWTIAFVNMQIQDYQDTMFVGERVSRHQKRLSNDLNGCESR